MLALSLHRGVALLALNLAVCLLPLAAQDTRTVTEPSFPASCTVLTAQLTAAGTDLAAADENSFDTSRIQAAINNCPAGQAVELAQDPTGNNAFLIQPITIATGVTLLVDPGVTVFASRNPRDYDVQPNTCGIVASASAGCQPILSIKSASNTGVMGFGVIDGRGGDTLIGPGAPANTSSWDLASQAQQENLSQFVPQLMNLSNSNNVTLYKITLKNSPTFHIATSGLNGFTVWGIKIVTPYTSRNTDGIDPGNSTNVTITNSYISDGDDEIAVGASHQGSSNISITNDHLYSGHGISIGSYTSGGVTNMLVDHLMLAGNANDSNANGIRIKSADDRGGTLTNITYQNMCIENVRYNLQITPQYNTNSGTLIPNYQSITLNNVHFLTEGQVELDGADSQRPLGLTLNNVTFDSLKASDITPASQYANITLGPGPVSRSLVSNLFGAGVTVTNNISNPSQAAFDCSNAFVYLAGELTAPSPVVAGGQVANLIAIVEPVVAGAPLPTGTVHITENGSVAATANLSGSSDLVTVALTNLSAGAHTYSATYSGDGNYAPLIFGAYTLTINSSSQPASQISLQGVPSAVTYGTSLPVALTVSGSGNTPTGSVEILQGSTVLATLPLASGAASYTVNSLPVGSYSLAAAYLGDSAHSSSLSSTSLLAVTQATTATSLKSSAAQANYGNTVTLTATVTSAAGAPTGSISFFDGGTQIGSATLFAGTATVNAALAQGPHAITASYLTTQNFAGSTSSPISVTINPSAANTLSILPAPLPYMISTAAGGPTTACSSGSGIGDGCPATQAVLSSDLRGVAVDAFGNIFFTDTNNNRIREINTAGTISTFAGGGTLCSAKIDTYGDGCPVAQTANFNHPRGIWVDANSNVFIAGYGDNLIHEVQASTGKMIMVAGLLSGTSSVSGTGADNIPATTSALKNPRGVWTDNNGNIYIADTANNRIRVVYTAGLIPNVATPVVGNIYTLAGNGTAGTAGDSGPANATVVEINNTQGGITDVNGNVFIADGGGRIRVIYMGGDLVAHLISTENAGVTAHTGYIYSVAGGGSSVLGANRLALAVSVALGGPQKFALDAAGNLYISDSSANAVWFLDIRTGYLRLLAGGAATVCTAATNTIGDGCPGVQALLSSGGSGIGVALDPQGNLYVTDSAHTRIRKVSTDIAFSATASGSSQTQPLFVHFLPGDSPASSNPFVLPATFKDFSTTAPVCSTNTDTTVDCLLQLQFTPLAPGIRSAPFTVSSTAGAIADLGLAGIGLGSGGAIDPAVQFTLGSNLTPQGVTVDDAQNVYVSDASSNRVLKYTPGATAGATVAAGLQSPRGLAVDPAGNVYVADSAAGSVQRIAPDGTVSSVGSNLKTPEALALDTNGNIYIADASQPSLIVVASNLITQTTLRSGFSTPASVAVDAAFNVYVADRAAGTVTKITPAGTSTVVNTGASMPTAVAVDSAANLYVTDSSSLKLMLVPASGQPPLPIAANLQSPQSLALDGAGNVYIADAGKTSLLALKRTQGTISLPDTTTVLTATLSSIGNQAITPSANGFSQSDSTDFNLSTAGVGGCNFAIAIAAGSACVLSAQLTPQHIGSLADVATLTGNYSNINLATPRSLQLTLTGNASGVTASTTLSIGSISPAAPVYGQSITLQATVTSNAGTPTGTVTFSIDGAPLPAVALNAQGAVSTSASAPVAGSHTLVAAYSGSLTFAGSSATGSFSVAQAGSSVNWMPPSSSIVYGTPLSAILNATASAPGTFTYTLQNSTAALSPTAVLPVGAYTLVAHFTPTDATDYAPSSAQVTLSVTPASTSTGAGLTQSVVASDGSANFTSVTAALQSLPASGGALYIKPGTYKEQVIVNTPNVSFYGLGGDPGKVIITNDIPAGPNNFGPKVGDQGSATVQALANGFYADYLTLQNTFDMEQNQDTTPNAQALALWVTSDKAVFNKLNLISRQDTIYGGSKGCTSTTCVPARQYFYSSYVEGNVDYIFGDGATVFDFSTIHTVYHGTASGEATITAQNKKFTGSGSYLSGEVFYNCTLTAESDAGVMTNLYLGRPYGVYSTNVYLNTSMQAPINPAGWIEFTPGVTNSLPTSYYAEYNSTGPGASGPREAYATQLSATSAAPWQPLTFLAGSDGWNPQTTLAQQQAAAVPPTKSLTVPSGSSLTLVTRIAPAVSGIPTGTAIILDGAATLAFVNVDASGEVNFTTSSLSVGPHSLTVRYSGDSNFTASTSSPVTVTITAACAANVSAQVAVSAGGFRFDRSSGLFSQAVTVTNNGPAALSGISLVLNGLTPNATLSNAGGATQCAAPVGSPWIAVVSSLPAGQYASVTLNFLDPSKAGIQYTTTVLAGAGSQ